MDKGMVTSITSTSLGEMTSIIIKDPVTVITLAQI
jgi:uncharacterized membrane protein YjjB (DUF3815 family)